MSWKPPCTNPGERSEYNLERFNACTRENVKAFLARGGKFVFIAFNPSDRKPVVEKLSKDELTDEGEPRNFTIDVVLRNPTQEQVNKLTKTLEERLKAPYAGISKDGERLAPAYKIVDELDARSDALDTPWV